MPVATTQIEGLLDVTWPKHDDERGFFRQVWQQPEIEAALGRSFHVAQTNHARSHSGVIRGLHAEPWDKLVTVTAGTALIVVVDIRPNSATFGTSEGFWLGESPGTHAAVFVSEGLAHGYAVTSEEADIVYSVSKPWSDVNKRAVAWDDPDLAIEWPVSDPILSEADHTNPTLRERFPDHRRFTR